MKKQMSLTNLILVLLIIVVSVLGFTQYNEKATLKNEIKELQDKLKNEQEYNLLNEKTKEFIEKSSEAKHKSLLTGKALKEMEHQLEQEEMNNHPHDSNVVDNIEYHNIYATKTGENTGESYAIYRIYYGDSPIQMQQIVTMSIHLYWDKVEGEFKVSDYQIHLLKDSLDEHLKELLIKEQEGEIENGSE